MDNKQNQPSNNLPPTAQPQAPTPATAPDANAAAPQPTPKKKRTGLIIGIIIAIIALIGGGVFAAFAIIKSDPTNMLLDSFNNLITADQVAVNGNLALTPKSGGMIGIDSVNLNFNSEKVKANQQAEASLQINFTDGSSTSMIDFGEVMLQNGVFYLHVNGLKDLYQNNFRNSISSSANTQILAQIDNIIDKVDNQWFEVSIEDILNDELFANQSTIPEVTKKGIISSYNCSIDVLNQIPNYSGEFSDLYSHYPFIKLNPGQDNYYNVSLDANNLAGYLNNVNNLSFYQDLTNCIGTTIQDNTYQVSAEEIKSGLSYLPNVSLHFNGLLNHHLTDMKVTQTNNYYDLSLDLNFTYPSNIQISAPSDSRPIIDLVKEIYNMFVSTYN